MINILLSMPHIDKDELYETLKGVIKENMVVSVIPFAFKNDVKRKEHFDLLYHPITGKYYQDIVKPFARYGIKEEQISIVDYFLDTRVSFKRKIEKSDILYFTGGLPDWMMERIIKADVVQEIVEFEGIIMEFSAGAMIQLDTYHISPDKDYSTFSYQKGLSIIKDMMIEVHYQNTEIQNKSIEKVKKDGYSNIYPIGDHGGILIDGERMITCFGNAEKLR